MWYAIRTEPEYEEAVKQQVEAMMTGRSPGDCRILYCIRKKRYQGAWHDKKERFLPGYMFLVTESAKVEREIASEWEENCEKLSQVVFSPVRQEEEEILIKLTGGSDEIGMSYGVIQDGVLEIRSGVLVGMEPRVKKIDRHKRKGYITMRINNEEKLAEIGLEIMERTCSAEKAGSIDRPGRAFSRGEGMACGM